MLYKIQIISLQQIHKFITGDGFFFVQIFWNSVEIIQMFFKKIVDKQSVVHLHSGIPLSIKKWINYQYTTNWMDLKVIMLSEISQNKQEHIYLHLYKILEIANEYILTGSRLVVV